MSINFFEAVFNDIALSPTGDTQVCCPFPHNINGTEYYETNPSAGINLEKNVFHCFSCNRAYSETSFCAKYLGMEYAQAIKFLDIFHKSINLDKWSYAEQNINNENPQTVLKNLHIPNEIIKQMHIGYRGGNSKEISIPIIIMNQIMDIITYRPGQVPKYKKEPNSISGLLCPFDLWIKEDPRRATLICAGEKDMLKARSMGLNAISFTGGEQHVPEMFLNFFKNRDNIYIIYDNDAPGKDGARKLATAIRKYTTGVHIVDLSPICKENKEDLYDFFTKYGKTKNDLIKIMEQTPIMTEEEYKEEVNKQTPLIQLSKALSIGNIDKTYRSNIQIIAMADSTFSAPLIIEAEKKKEASDEDVMKQGETRYWELNETNYKDLFYLIDSKLKEDIIDASIKTRLLKIPKKEQGVVIYKKNKTNIYKAYITDYTEDVTDESIPVELTAFSIDKKLENGKKYLITYRLVPHPQDGQRLIAVIKDVEETNTFLDNFKIDEKVKSNLSVFQQKENQTFKENYDNIINKVKGIVKADLDNNLLEVIDLWFHTVIQFIVPNKGKIRGYLDTLIVGESRIGKSATAKALRDTYQVGKIVSLAGNSATTQGLVGGSDKVAGGSYRTRAGLIPQNNKSAIIFEELIKCKSDLIKELTEIRSSNTVKITRVSGNIELPAYVRMLTITNCKTEGSTPKPINSYPNGISILTDIVGTAEDINRYDVLAIFGNEAQKEINIDFENNMPEPFTNEQYQTRIRWIWSRKPEQVIISKDLFIYTTIRTNELNKLYSSYIQIFGIESRFKILRLAVAIAGYVVSTDNSYEVIIVKKEHVDKAIDLLVNLYDNPTFKLREYAKKEKDFMEITPEDIRILQEVYNDYPNAINYLMNTMNITSQSLQIALNNTNINRLIANLTLHNFIRIESNYIIPTLKFNKAYEQIDKKILQKGEVILSV